MKNLPVIPQDNGPAKQELRRRIALANRPHLNIGMDRLDAISSILAKSNRDRTLFVENPTTYLQGQALPVSSCNLVAASPAQTSEVCSVNAVCNANAFANVNVGTKVNVALAVNAFTIANAVNTVYVYNQVRFWGYDEQMYMVDEGFIASNGGSPFGSGVL